jgi:hypothetical protein
MQRKMIELRPIGFRYYEYSTWYTWGDRSIHKDEKFARTTIEVIDHQLSTEILRVIDYEISPTQWDITDTPYQPFECEVCTGYHGKNLNCMRND